MAPSGNWREIEDEDVFASFLDVVVSIPGLILLFVIAVLAYSMFRVHKQRQEIRVQAIDPIWEIPDAP